MSGVKVHALGGEELTEGTKVRHPKYTGTVIKVIPSAGTVRIRKDDGTEVIARGHKVSVITDGADPIPTPAPTANMTPGSAGIDPATGLPYFVGRDGNVFQIGDTIVHAKKGEGTVKSIYVGATSVAVDWADGTSNRAQANALFGKDSGGEIAPKPVDVPTEPVDVPTEPTVVEPVSAPAVTEPEPVSAPEPAPTPVVKLSGQMTDPEPKKKLTVKGGEIEGGDPVGKNGPVSPHGEPLPGDQTDLMQLSMLYPTGSVITYHNKTSGVKYRIQKGDDFLWHEVDENGAMDHDTFHQYIPYLSRTQMSVKIDPNGTRDTRNEAPDNEEWLNAIPVGGTVTTNGHWDGGQKVWTKVTDGYWKTDDMGALNAGVTRYNIVDSSGNDGYEPVDAEGLGWTPFESGPTRKMKIFKLPNGAEITFSKAPNVHFVKENGKWAEFIRGQRTGTTYINLNSLSDGSSGWPAFVNMANASTEVVSTVPQRQRPANLKGDPKEIEAVFGSDMGGYKGVDTLFRGYDSKTSPFNVLNHPEGRAMGGSDASAVNAAGDKFVPGARVYNSQGDYMGKVEVVLKSRYDGIPSKVILQHPAGEGLYNKDKNKLPDFVSIEDLTTVRTKHWDTSTDLDFSDATSKSDIERKMNETYGGFAFKFAPRATDIRTARQFAETVSKIFNKYPQLQESMTFVGTEPFGRTSSANAAAWSFGPPGFGTYGDDYNKRHDPHDGRVGTRIGFNVSNSYENFVRGKRESQRTRWNNFVEEGKEVEATTTHEFGHALDYLTGVISEQKILQFVSEVLGREVTKNDSSLGYELKQADLLSGYSLTRVGTVNPVELVAESFQDVEMNGANAKELSKLVHQELMRRLAILGTPSVEYANSNVGASSEGVAV